MDGALPVNVKKKWKEFFDAREKILSGVQSTSSVPDVKREGKIYEVCAPNHGWPAKMRQRIVKRSI